MQPRNYLRAKFSGVIRVNFCFAVSQVLPSQPGPPDISLTRWEIESSLDELKTHLRGSQVVLRSKTPEMFEAFFKYDWVGKTSRRHRAKIREFFGFREVAADDMRKLSDWLITKHIVGSANHQRVKDTAYQRLKELKIEPPERTRLDRLVRSATKKHESKVFEDIVAAIPKRVRKRLEALYRIGRR